MDLGQRSILFLVGLSFFVLQLCYLANANLVFPVERKFKGPVRNLASIKAHDAGRRGRFLSIVDVPLGGNGRPNLNGLYYTKIGLGPQTFYVQVDTGSDTLWVNCVGCNACPKKSRLGMDLSLYDLKGSKTAEEIKCDDEFCTTTYDGEISGCNKDMVCPYSITYGDGSSTSGSYLKDILTFDRIDSDLRDVPDNTTNVIFGCGVRQSGTLGSNSDESLDGIIGFGQANSSVLSQLAAAGRVNRVFSHCLDSINGGGIYSIGEVVEPKVKTAPLVPNMAHYNVVLKDMEVGGEPIQLPTDFFDSSSGRGTIIDSGTTLAYLPPNVYDQLVEKVLAGHDDLKYYLVEEQFTCFTFREENVDKEFPIVKFTFEEGLTLTVYPHDYLFILKGDEWCIGWQKSTAQTRDGKEIILLGDLVLSNKLVVYDLENMTIGWGDYNCSDSIKVKDYKTGNVYKVGAHDISSAATVLMGRILLFCLLLIAMLST